MGPNVTVSFVAAASNPMKNMPDNYGLEI